MKNTCVLSLACIYGIAFLSPCCGERQTFFRHRGESIERRSHEDEASSQNIANQWFKRYYHAKTPELDNSRSATMYSSDTPDQFYWLIKNILNQQQHENSEDNGYPANMFLRDTNLLKINPSFLGDEENTDDSIDYRDIYNSGSPIAQPNQIEDGFRQALMDYLMQQNTPSAQHDDDKPVQSESNEDSLEKKAPVKETPTESPASLRPSTISIISPPAKVTSEATSSADVTSSNNLSVMPPVSIGKGQKEFPMLRPASENSRKFDNWAQNFEKSMAASTFEKVRQPIAKQQYPVDSLTEELNKLKAQSQQDIRKPHQSIWY